MYWRPPATGPPTPSRNGGSIFASAPPSRSSTTPVRTQHHAHAELAARSAPRPPTRRTPRARKSRPGGASSSSGSSPCGAVVADRRGADQRARARLGRRRRPATRLRVPRHAALADRALGLRAPALGDRLAGEVDDRVAARQRLRRAPARRAGPSATASTAGRALRARARSGSRESTVTCVAARRCSARDQPRADQAGRARDGHAHGARASVRSRRGRSAASRRVSVSPCAKPTSWPGARRARSRAPRRRRPRPPRARRRG